jgi:hypothetical protein
LNLKNRRGGRGRKSKADNQEVGTLILRFAKRYVLCGQGWLPLSPHQLAAARSPVDYSPSTRYSDAELNGTTLLSPQQLDNRTQGVIWELHSLLPEGLEEEDLSKTLFETVCPSFPATCAYPWQVNSHMSDYRSHIQNRLRTNMRALLHGIASLSDHDLARYEDSEYRSTSQTFLHLQGYTERGE